MLHLTWSVLLVLTLLWPVTTHALPRLEVALRSEPGDFLGLGQTYFFDENDVVSPLGFTAADRNGDGQADFSDFFLLGDIVGGACDDPLRLCFMSLTFGTDQLGTNLVPGFYDDAQRAPFAQPGHPGLDIGLNGRGCNTSTGRFTIGDTAFNTSLQVVRFAVSFEQHCEGGEPALFGSLIFDDRNDSNPVPEPSTYVMFGSGLLGLLGYTWRRSKQAA